MSRSPPTKARSSFPSRGARRGPSRGSQRRNTRNMAPIDLAQAFKGREILITGTTGFLGKVALTMLLDRYPGIGKVYVLVRPRAGGTADDRFFGKVVSTPPFNPLRERLGDRFDAFLREKCVPLAGDVTDPMLGLSEEQLKRLTGKLACVINSAGLV